MVNAYEFLRDPFQAVRILPGQVMLQSRVPTQAKEYPKARRFRSTQVKMLYLSEDPQVAL